LRDLDRAERLPEAVERIERGRHAVAEEIARMRNDRRDAGADRIAFPNRDVPHTHTVDVGDRIESPDGEATDRDAEIAGAHAAHLAPARVDDVERRLGQDVRVDVTIEVAKRDRTVAVRGKPLDALLE